MATAENPAPRPKLRLDYLDALRGLAALAVGYFHMAMSIREQGLPLSPGEAPVMVYQLYNRPPFAVLTPKDSGVEDMKDLAGRKVGGPAGSAATRLLPALLARNGVAVPSVEVLNMQPNLQEQMLIRGEVAEPELIRGLISAMAPDGTAVNLVDLTNGHVTERLTDPGYRILPALAACALDGTAIPAELRRFQPTLYYPSTLHLLSLAYVAERHPECLS